MATLTKSSNWNNASTKLVFDPPEGEAYSYSLWAPELHEIDERWYIIFTANADNESPPPETDMLCDYTCPAVNHRMFVLESSGSDPWESNYSLKGQLDTYDQFALDVSNPWTVSTPLSQRTILSVPTLPWEKTPYGRPTNNRLSSNEAPQQLTNPHNPNRTYIIYSAARSDNRNYCLGQLELVGQDPMNVNDWRKTIEGPVFYQNALEEAYGVGHASFTTSPDGRENWMVYHGMSDPLGGWRARTIRAQRFEWGDDEVCGDPSFPRPGYGPYRVPSGQV
ncbi:hypothetical protein EPUS_00933 [Endocarpon pusillum Z07020]|uniref:Uncharacterized protein n=1 Tax=Endocarpon pusillum (strain Z07020 / HMAS-L-300199) TaxID=1263415 RepID=U1HT07_ENDPU|nr:uncharacterized protein EPUS_00933 [Endocarpon pusillum Z07020]ERF73680.1 hypothetical protein EPUS_00933 [Endocarpon pusillum Z07020]